MTASLNPNAWRDLISPRRCRAPRRRVFPWRPAAALPFLHEVTIDD